MRRRALALIAVGVLQAAAATAQDFASALPPLEGDGPAFLEHGLPPAAMGWSIESASVLWFGTPELITRSLAVGGAWRSSRAQIGVSRTGEGALGWSAAAAGAGMGGADRAAAVRVCARRSESGESGAEFGLGAWSRVGESMRLWASAPQVWTDGEPPPLERHLELGIQWRTDALRAWLQRSGAPAGVDGLASDHAAGIAIAGRGLLTWIVLRDRPVRGAFGIAGGRGGLRVAVTIDSHPVLSETVRMAIAWAGARAVAEEPVR